MKDTIKKLKTFALSLLSRKLILSVIAGFVAFGNSYWNWGMKIEEVLAIITPLMIFVGAEGWADAKRAENE